MEHLRSFHREVAFWDEVTISNKNDQLLAEFNITGVEALQNQPHLFSLVKESNSVWTVRSKIPIRLCQQYLDSSELCPGTCKRLHLCKQFILSKDSCVSPCKLQLSHVISDDHNRNILRKYPELKLFQPLHLEKNCYAVTNIISSSFPRLCDNLLELGICDKSFCGKLHICPKVIYKRCSKIPGECPIPSAEAHNWSSKHNKKVLKSFQLNPESSTQHELLTNLLVSSRISAQEEKENSVKVPPKTQEHSKGSAQDESTQNRHGRLLLCYYYQQRCCDQKPCARLHMCKNFLTDESNCPDKVCESGFSHDPFDENNLFIIKKHNLFYLSKTEVLRQLRQMFPRVCKGYDEDMNCKVLDCKRLHMCSPYLYGNCTDEDCKGSHDFYDFHNKDVLATFKLERYQEKHYTIANILSLDLGTKRKHKASKMSDQSAQGNEPARKSYVPLSLCYYYQQRLCDKKPCKGLHMCKNFLTDETKCPDEICESGFSHDPFDQNNLAVMKKHKLDKLRRTETLQKLRQMFPRVCKKYDKDTNCKVLDCKKLHMCSLYLYDNCNNKDCKRSHDFYDHHNTEVLATFKLERYQEKHYSVANILSLDLGIKQKNKTSKGPDQPAQKSHGPLLLCYYYQQRFCDKKTCPRLHLCKNFLIDENKCPHEICELGFSHDPFDENNLVVMKKHRLNSLSRAEAVHRLRQMFPRVCNKYFQDKGCNVLDCKRLHICLQYLYGHCNIIDCKNSHDFYDIHNTEVLAIFKLDGYQEKHYTTANILSLDLGIKKRNKTSKIPHRSVQDNKPAKKSYVPLLLCYYYQQRLCDKKPCERLHMCKNFLTDEIKCPDEICESGFSHDPFDENNLAVMKRHKLDDLRRSEALQQLRQMFPRVCETYNKDMKCKVLNCKKLHMCSSYLYGHCDEKDCNRSHDLYDFHNKDVLATFKLGRFQEEHNAIANILSLDLGIKRKKQTSKLPDQLAQENEPPRKSYSSLLLCYYYQQGCCDQKPCACLHMCKNFLTDERKCLDKTCKLGFSHDPFDENNSLLMKKHRLNDLGQTEVLRKLRQMFPQACIKYNKDMNCKSPSCKGMHVCLPYLYDNCSKKDCIRSHDLYDSHNRRVLSTFKLEKLQGKQYITANILSLDLHLQRKENDSEKSNESLKLCHSYQQKQCDKNKCPHVHLCKDKVQEKEQILSFDLCKNKGKKTSTTERECKESLQVSKSTENGVNDTKDFKLVSSVLISSENHEESIENTHHASETSCTTQKHDLLSSYISATQKVPLVLKSNTKASKKILSCSDENEMTEQRKIESVYKNSLSLCSQYLKHTCPKHCVHTPPRLHLCKNFLVNAENCQETVCEYGYSHDPFNKNNLIVLKNNGLGGLNRGSALERLRQMFPRICRNYDKTSQCRNIDCNRIHVCFDYIFDMCSDSYCKRSHNLHDSHNKSVLDAFQLDDIKEKQHVVANILFKRNYVKKGEAVSKISGEDDYRKNHCTTNSEISKQIPIEQGSKDLIMKSRISTDDNSIPDYRKLQLSAVECTLLEPTLNTLVASAQILSQTSTVVFEGKLILQQKTHSMSEEVDGTPQNSSIKSEVMCPQNNACIATDTVCKQDILMCRMGNYVETSKATTDMVKAEGHTKIVQRNQTDTENQKNFVQIHPTNAEGHVESAESDQNSLENQNTWVDAGRVASQIKPLKGDETNPRHQKISVQTDQNTLGNQKKFVETSKANVKRQIKTVPSDKAKTGNQCKTVQINETNIRDQMKAELANPANQGMNQKKTLQSSKANLVNGVKTIKTDQTNQGNQKNIVQASEMNAGIRVKTMQADQTNTGTQKKAVKINETNIEDQAKTIQEGLANPEMNKTKSLQAHEANLGNEVKALQTVHTNQGNQKIIVEASKMNAGIQVRTTQADQANTGTQKKAVKINETDIGNGVKSLQTDQTNQKNQKIIIAQGGIMNAGIPVKTMQTSQTNTRTQRKAVKISDTNIGNDLQGDQAKSMNQEKATHAPGTSVGKEMKSIQTDETNLRNQTVQASDMNIGNQLKAIQAGLGRFSDKTIWLGGCTPQTPQKHKVVSSSLQFSLQAMHATKNHVEDEVKTVKVDPTNSGSKKTVQTDKTNLETKDTISRAVLVHKSGVENKDISQVDIYTKTSPTNKNKDIVEAIFSSLVKLTDDASCNIADEHVLKHFDDGASIDEWVKSVHVWFVKNEATFRLSGRSNDNLLYKRVHASVRDVKACIDYWRATGCTNRDCHSFHICKKWLCGIDHSIISCKSNHDLASPREKSLVQGTFLEKLSANELAKLLRNRYPYVCVDNYSGCSAGQYCPNFHVCYGYVNGTCKKKDGVCEQKHDSAFNGAQAVRLMKEYHIDQTDIKDTILLPNSGIPTLCHTELVLQTKKDFNFLKEAALCHQHIASACVAGSQCSLLHTENKLPFLWQYSDNSDDTWTTLSADVNMQVEIAYCDPKNDSARTGDADILFAYDPSQKSFTGTYKKNPARYRRLSTQSNVDFEREAALTEWKWYWKISESEWEEYSKWVTSPDIEKLYLKYTTMWFKTNEFDYTISFEKMEQQNQDKRFLTKRKVRRRPLIQRYIKSPANPIPSHWPEKFPEGQRINVDTEKYESLEDDFKKSIGRHIYVLNIEEICNEEFFVKYQGKKRALMKKLGEDKINERFLYHGTDEASVSAVCAQNFDWRLCGKNGTLYGDGSYFACDASYSHSYAGSNRQSVKYMFLASVLVGQYTQGTKSLKRPPSIPSKDNELYDSCVDHTHDPSIFVIFERDQCYPRYLISYTEDYHCKILYTPPATTLHPCVPVPSQHAPTYIVLPPSTSAVPNSASALNSSSLPSTLLTPPASATPSSNSYAVPTAFVGVQPLVPPNRTPNPLKSGKTNKECIIL